MADNLKKIGAKITLDGEKEYRQALKNITSEQKVLKSEMKLAQAQYKATGGSIDSMKQKSKVLTEQIESQSSKVDVLKEALEKAKEQYGENSTQANNWQTQLNNAEADLVSLNSALADNERALEEAQSGATDAGIAIGALDKELEDTESTSKGWGARLLENLSFTDIVNLGKTALGVISSAAQTVYQTVKESAQYADDVLTEAAQNGIDTADVQVFKYMSELIDTPTETIEGAMTRVTKAMGSAKDGSEKYQTAFENLGVAYQNEDGTFRDTADVFWDVVDSLGKMEPGAERDNIAMQLLGKNAKELTGLINTGREGFEKYREEAEKTGTVLSDPQLSVLGETSDALYRLDQAVEGFKLQASLVFAPAINDILGTITGLITGTTQLISGLSDDFLLEVAEIDKKDDELRQKLADDKESFATEQSVISGSVEYAGQLADRIYELAGKSNRTAAEENELAAALMKINKLVPGLNLEFDKQTGMLSKTRSEVDKLTESYKKQALEQAFAKRRAELLEDYGTAVIASLDAQQKMLGKAGDHLDWYRTLQESYDAFDDLGESSNRLSTAVADALETLGIFEEENSELYNDAYLWMEALGEGVEKVNKTSNTVTMAEQAMEDYNEQCRMAADQMGITTETIDDLSEASENAAGNTDELGNSISGFGDEAEDAAEELTALEKELKTYADSAGLSLDDVKAHFEELADAYAEAYNAAESSISGQTGLFQKLTGESEVTAEQMLTNLLGQNEILEQWTEDIKALAAAGLEDGLVQQLIDAGPSAAQAVHDMAAQITDENNTFIENLNSAYAEQLDIKSGFASAMAEAQTGFNEYAQELGLSSEVVEEELASRGVSAGNAFGENLIDGLAESAALNDNAEEILKKAEDNAEAYKQSGESAATNYTEGMQTALATSKEQLATDLSEIETMFQTSKDNIGAFGTDASTDFLTNLNAQLADETNLGTVSGNITTIEGYFGTAVTQLGDYGTQSGEDFMNNLIAKLGDSEKLYGPNNSVDFKLHTIMSIPAGKVGQMTTIGNNLGNALLDGIINKISERHPDLRIAINSIKATVDGAMQINSPSKVMMHEGAYIGGGLIDGTLMALEDGLPNITEEMARMTEQLTGAGLGSLSMAPAASSAPVAVTYTAELAALRNDIAALSHAILERPIMLDSGELVGGLSDKMDMSFAQSMVHNQRRN